MEKNKIKYVFFKWLLGLPFLIYYRPKFVNKNLIPKEGPIIVCGNHIHLYDQCMPCLSTKRMLHYMAKKEYFESSFAWFFKQTGCISVDRSNHGGDSKEKALEVLNEGYGIGIYPEGTRNSVASKEEKFNELYSLYKEEMSPKKFKKILKKNLVRVSQTDYLKELKDKNKINDEEYKKFILDANTYLKMLVKKGTISVSRYEKSLLLPIKYGTVSLAQKTNATIVPYGIKGKYSFLKNKLTIVYGKPFKVGNMSLEEANKKLERTIIDIIKN